MHPTPIHAAPFMSPRLTHHLIRQHEHCLDRELAAAEIEEVLQAGTEQVDHHHVVLALDAIPPQIGDPSCGKGSAVAMISGPGNLAAGKMCAAPILTSPLQNLVELGFIEQLRMPGLNRFLRNASLDGSAWPLYRQALAHLPA